MIRYDPQGKQVSTVGEEVKPINIDPGMWPLYRLVVERIVSWNELETRLSILDVANLNEALDLKLAGSGQITLEAITP